METTQLHNVLTWAELILRKYDLCFSVERRSICDAQPAAIRKCDRTDRGDLPMDWYG